MPRGKTGICIFAPVAFDAALNHLIHVTADLSASGPSALVCKYDLRADGDVPMTALALSFGTGAEAGKAVLTTADGKQQTIALPSGPADDVAAVRKLEIRLDRFGSITAEFDPPVAVAHQCGAGEADRRGASRPPIAPRAWYSRRGRRPRR